MADDESEWFSRGYPKDTLGWVEFLAKFAEAVEGFFQVRDGLILALGLHNDIVDVGFNIAR